MTSHPKSPRTTGNEAEHKYCPRPQVLNKDMNERVAVVPHARLPQTRSRSAPAQTSKFHKPHLTFIGFAVEAMKRKMNKII